MIPNNTAVVERSGNLGGTEIKMGVDSNSIEHLMSLLTNLYSDAELAIIREYTTNAWDSHVEAGQTRPIEVTTPSAMSPFFKVKDFGVGLNEQDIANVYALYGASTKRTSDTTTGMLGVGCKSALTYTNSFTVIGVKDGVKTSVVISRMENGAGVMQVIGTVPTTESNGVEISIPVKFSKSFDSKVHEFVKAWEPGTILVNGSQPKSYREIGTKIIDSIYLVNDGDGPKDRIVMGNVAYPVEHGLNDGIGGFYREFSVIAFVSIGDVAFVPSREALDYREELNTHATIFKIRRDFRENLKNRLQEQIDDCATHGDALRKSQEFNYSGIGNFTYKSVPIETQYWLNHIAYHPYVARYQVDRLSKVSYDDVMSSLVIVGFNFDSPTTTHKEKIKRWISENDTTIRKVLLCTSHPGLPWTEGANVIDYERDVKPIRLVEKAARVKRVRAKYDILNEHGYYSETDDIDDTKSIYYHSPTEKYNSESLRILFPDDVIVKIGRNRFDKFQRDFPKAKALRPEIKDKVVECAKGLTKDDLISAGISQYDKSYYYRALDSSKIDDPEIKKYLSYFGVVSDGLRRYNAAIEAASNLGIYVEGLQTIHIDSPFKKYPLMPLLTNSDRVRNHAIVYLNAAYAAMNKES